MEGVMLSNGPLRIIKWRRGRDSEATMKRHCGLRRRRHLDDKTRHGTGTRNGRRTSLSAVTDLSCISGTKACPRNISQGSRGV